MEARDSLKPILGGALTGARGALLLLAACCLPPAPAVAADWPMFRGNAARTGFVSEQAAPPLTRVWEYQAGGGIVSSPVIYGGLVYFGARDGKIRAFYAGTGVPAWEYQAGGRVDSTPAVAGSALYAASTEGYLYALDRLTGALLWKATLGAFSISSPLVLEGRVYLGTGSPENKLMVFEAASGRLLASLQAGQPVDSAPSSDGQRIYFGANDGRLYAADKVTLAPAWSYQTRGGRYGIKAAAVASGLVYALPGFDENKPLAFNAADGVLVNRLNGPFEEDVTQPDGTMAWRQAGSPVVSADRLYFSGGSVANTLFAAEAVPVSEALPYVWVSSPALGAISASGLLSSPAMANEIVYSGTVGGSLVAFSSAAAPVALVADVSFSSPVYASPGVANGMIFVGASGGEFAAYRAARVAALASPAAGAVVNGVVPLTGWVANPALSGYTLEYSSGGGPAVWHTILSSATAYAVEGAGLADWDTSALENGAYTVRLTVLEPGTPAYVNTALLALRVNAPPSPPSGLTAADVPADAGNNVLLTWTASATPDAAYRVYRDAGEGLALLGVSAAGLTAYNDAAAVTGSTYTYAVRAFDGYAESENSNLAQAFSVNDSNDNTPPAAVTDLAAEPSPLPGGITLTWTATGNDGNLGSAAYFLIKYSPDPGADWPAFDGVLLSSAVKTAEGPAGDNISAEIRGLLGGVTYYFALKAADAVGNIGSLSNVTTAYAAPDYTPPLPPDGLSVTDTPGDDGGRLTLAWSLSPDDGGGAGDVYGYRVYRRLQNETYGQAPYAVTGPGAASYTDPAAPENIRYYYSVAAFDSTNESQRSGEAGGVSADNWRFFDAAEGGSVRLADGARVDVPGGAASQNDSILFVKLDPATRQPVVRARAAGGANPTSVVYAVHFENAATRLLSPARIALPYTDAEVAGMNTENLRLYTLSGDAWAMLNTSEVDAGARLVSAEVLHFSTYTIMEYLPSGTLLEAGEVYTYPNPAKGDTVTFKFRPAYKAYVKIEVYNVAGERVARLEKADCPAGQASEIVWNVKGIASGVYVLRLEAASAAGSKTVTKRFAIAH